MVVITTLLAKIVTNGEVGVNKVAYIQNKFVWCGGGGGVGGGHPKNSFVSQGAVKTLAGFLGDSHIEVDHADGHAAEYLCSRKVLGQTDSVTHYPVPCNLEPSTGTDQRIFVDLDSDFCW